MAHDIESLRAFFAADKFAMDAGIRIESAAEDEVVVSLAIEDRHRNAMGGVQGGAIFTLADLAFAVHSNLSFLSGETGPTVGQSCSVSYLKATRGTKLTARSANLSRGRSVSVFRITVTDDLGVAIAEVLCNGFTTLNK